MRRTTHVFAGLYALLSVGLFRCALVSYQHDAWGYTAFFAAASIALATAIVHNSVLLDEIRHALARLDAATRATTRPANASEDDAVHLALAKACCESWWTSCGFHHDPTCPNDQHRSAA